MMCDLDCEAQRPGNGTPKDPAEVCLAALTHPLLRAWQDSETRAPGEDTDCSVADRRV